jgi:uncharacterized protein with von Willebrand factor type A (vWA) domain
METYRTKPHPNYFTPDAGEIRRAFEGSRLTVSLPFVQDICNYLSWTERGENGARAFVPVSSLDYRQLAEQKGRRFDTAEQFKSFVRRQTQIDKNVQKFLNEFDFAKLEGASPLEKARNLLTALAEMPGGEADAEGEDLPIFSREKIEQKIEQVEQFLDDLKHFSEHQERIIGLEGSQADKIQKLPEGEAATLARISRLLRDKKFEAKKARKFRETATGKIRKRVLMTDYGQLPKVAPRLAFGLPNFDVRLATKDLHVQVKGEYIESKQLLYVLLDESGSMDTSFRRAAAKAVLLNRLEAVAKGEAVLFFTFFDDSCSQEFRVEAAAEARELWHTVEKCGFNGGGTDIDGCLRKVVERIQAIEKEGRYRAPEICIVTDGEDSVGLQKGNLNGYKLHSFVIDSQNNKLIRLAEETGGLSMQIRE